MQNCCEDYIHQTGQSSDHVCVNYRWENFVEVCREPRILVGGSLASFTTLRPEGSALTIVIGLDQNFTSTSNWASTHILSRMTVTCSPTGSFGWVWLVLAMSWIREAIDTQLPSKMHLKYTHLDKYVIEAVAKITPQHQTAKKWSQGLNWFTKTIRRVEIQYKICE